MLFHGSISENKKSILNEGLKPTTGALVLDCYGEVTPLIFASSIETIERALIAIRKQIYLKFKKELDLYNECEVTSEMIENYGVLFSIKSDKFSFCTEKLDVNSPIEKNDYYTSESVEIESYLEGSQLIEFIKLHSPAVLEHRICKRSKWGNF